MSIFMAVTGEEALKVLISCKTEKVKLCINFYFTLLFTLITLLSGTHIYNQAVACVTAQSNCVYCLAVAECRHDKDVKDACGGERSARVRAVEAEQIWGTDQRMTHVAISLRGGPKVAGRSDTGLRRTYVSVVRVSSRRTVVENPLSLISYIFSYCLCVKCKQMN